MKKIPVQFYIFAIALSVYCWPWVLFSSSAFTVFTLQLLFVIACNILVKQDWIIAVIIVELASMLFNVTFCIFTAIPADLHVQIMTSAFILELLIITTSLRLEAAIDHCRFSAPCANSIRSASYSVLHKNCGGAIT